MPRFVAILAFLAALACGGVADTAVAPDAIPAVEAAVGTREGVADTDAVAPPDVEVAEATGSRCPPGTHLAGLWQGEYPGPVVDVKAAVVVDSRADACAKEPSGPCTLPAGLYHPWSMDPATATSTTKFGTIREITRFRARRAYTIEGEAPVAIAAGEEIEIPAYYGEGICEWKVRGQTTDLGCPEMYSDDQGEVFEQLPGIPGFTEQQVLGVKCAEGYEAWIDVGPALFDKAEVEEGVIVEYGKVGPAGSAPGM